MLPESIEKFIRLVSKLPAIGPRQATRLAFYLVRQGKGAIAELESAFASLGRLETCAWCFFPYEARSAKLEPIPLCSICADATRNKKIIAIVEKETDRLSLEKTHAFQGRYLILGELARDGILQPEQKLKIQSLIAFIEKECGGKATEVLIALNPTTIGDIGAGILTDQLKPYAEKITRLGRGMPTGGEVEFADEDTLSGALRNRS